METTEQNTNQETKEETTQSQLGNEENSETVDKQVETNQDEATTQEETNEQDETTTQEEATDSKEQVSSEEITKQNLERLKQYEIQEKDRQDLLSKFGVEETQNNNYVLEVQQIEQQLDNRLRHDWVSLCNEYGLPSDLNTIQSSLEDLKTKDPDKYIKFSKEKDTLLNTVSSAKQNLHGEIITRGVQNFVQQNEQILNASPAIAQGVNSYIQSNLYNMSDPQSELTNVITLLAMVYKEAHAEGQKSALVNKAKNDTSGISGGASVNSSQTTYSTDHIFTRDEIRKMSLQEYSKNEKRIIEQMRQGSIK